ncbi:MAG TPA: hypothetical protein VL326_13225, partial [Kofleriaceae bacterium]|nr:hypothetical protein [Kofleriaceae bacterium]
GHGEHANVFLIGDSLGLAHPLTAEGILPASTSGRVLAESILAGDAGRYPVRLFQHPVIAEYHRTYRLIEAARRLKARRHANGNGSGNGAAKGSPADPLVARGFAWMFSGARMPAAKLVDFALDHLIDRRTITTDPSGRLFKERHERRVS